MFQGTIMIGKSACWQFQYISSKKILQTFIYDWIWYPINCLNFHSLKTILAAL